MRLLLTPLLVFFLILCSCCTKKELVQTNKIEEPIKFQGPKLPIRSIFLDSLKAVNLSEDLSPISTKNDEIYMIATLVSKSHPRKIRSSYTGTLNFDEDNMTNAIVTKMNVTEGYELIVALIEQDSNLDKTHLLTKFQSALLKELESGELEHFKLQEYLSDDDLLGFHKINTNSLWLYDSRKLIFKGNHLFDKYEYHFTIGINPTD